jgi:hypothetical protein
MRRWLFVIGLALAMAAPGCGGKGGKTGGGIVTEQPSGSEVEPGPGGRKVKRQAEEIGSVVKAQMSANTSWDQASVDKYTTAVQDALVQWVQSKSGLSKDQQKELIDTFPEFAKTGLAKTVSSETLQFNTDAAEYAIKLYAVRNPVNEATQEKIDSQIDSFCDALEPALMQYFSQRSTKEALTGAVADIRKTFKACSRNPWFPALKEPLDSKEESEVRDTIAQTLMSQLNDFSKKESEGGKLNFDWGVTSAWSAATKFVSKTIKPPRDRMLMFTHSPHGPVLGFQIRPQMFQPSPTGGAPTPSGAAPVAPGGAAPVVPPPPTTPPPAAPR